MNNELKQILKNQLALLDVEGSFYDKERRRNETIEILNPKEDLPYEKSIQVQEEIYICKECGFETHTAEGMTIHLKNHKPKFVKSSINEKEDKKQ